MDRSLIAIFEKALGHEAVLTAAADCLAYGYDNSSYRANPAMVLLPVRIEQVQTAVRLARQYKQPLTARGRGTNTTGASAQAVWVSACRRWRSAARFYRLPQFL